jgi:hypothetical protein
MNVANNGVGNLERYTVKNMGRLEIDSETGEATLVPPEKGKEVLTLSKEASLRQYYSIEMISRKNNPTGKLPDGADNNYLNQFAAKYAGALDKIREDIGDIPGQFKQHEDALDSVFKNTLDVGARADATKVAFNRMMNDPNFRNMSIDERNAKTAEYKSQVTEDLDSINSKFADLFTGFMKDNSFEDALSLTNSKLAESLSDSEKVTWAELNDLDTDYAAFDAFEVIKPAQKLDLKPIDMDALKKDSSIYQNTKFY